MGRFIFFYSKRHSKASALSSPLVRWDDRQLESLCNVSFVSGFSWQQALKGIFPCLHLLASLTGPLCPKTERGDTLSPQKVLMPEDPSAVIHLSNRTGGKSHVLSINKGSSGSGTRTLELGLASRQPSRLLYCWQSAHVLSHKVRKPSCFPRLDDSLWDPLLLSGSSLSWLLGLNILSP